MRRGPYIPPTKHSEWEAREGHRGEVFRRSQLDERQAVTQYKNLHHFAQLEAARFPGTVTLELNRYIDGRLFGAIATRMGYPVRRTRTMTSIITTGVERGYFLAKQAWKKNEGDDPDELNFTASGLALTNEGTVYRVAQWNQARQCAEINRYGIFRRPFLNEGIDLENYIGDDRVMTTVPTASPLETYTLQVQGSEELAEIFTGFTKRTLEEAGVSYDPPHMESATRIVADPATGATEPITRRMPTA